MIAVIYQKSKCSNQSGICGKNDWFLKFSSSENHKKKSNIMNWLGSDNMDEQININFSSKELAINYAKKHNINYEIIEINQTKRRHKSYASNFNKPPL